MSDADALILEYDLDAPPAKVWRAISIPAFREQWLPAAALVDPEGVAVMPGEAVRYRLRDAAPPCRDSHVTFRIAPNADGGTRLSILHELVHVANDNGQILMRAA
ncbi:SRPBCC domain-containing protein [Sphingomonas sp. 2SG]|uniref:SRPBCC family protein n=1 Tax=Sphingomonas sp. 2SG TaxID=2502201 RepID=UPI0010F63B4C|nr:SRPBCC domain-containing protein [Sphingomonas sp. 2SG]